MQESFFLEFVCSKLTELTHSNPALPVYHQSLERPESTVEAWETCIHIFPRMWVLLTVFFTLYTNECTSRNNGLMWESAPYTTFTILNNTAMKAFRLTPSFVKGPSRECTSCASWESSTCCWSCFLNSTHLDWMCVHSIYQSDKSATKQDKNCLQQAVQTAE